MRHLFFPLEKKHLSREVSSTVQYKKSETVILSAVFFYVSESEPVVFLHYEFLFFLSFI
jgi:hypothetical protein